MTLTSFQTQDGERTRNNSFEQMKSPLSQASTCCPPSPMASFMTLDGFPTKSYVEDDILRYYTESDGAIDTMASADDGTQGETEMFYIDNHKLQAQTLGIAYRLSKRLQDRDHSLPGVAWDTLVVGQDEGDGWIRVGKHYLPMALGGVPVITVVAEGDAPEAPQHPGAGPGRPALTLDGQVVSSDGGPALTLPCDEQHPGYHARAEVEREFRRLRARAARDAAARVEAGEVCSISADGMVRGPVTPPGRAALQRAARLKLHHRARRQRQRQRKVLAGREDLTLCIGQDGKAVVWLRLESSAARLERSLRRERIEARKATEAPGAGVLSVDSAGTVREPGS